jgi:hypothetical protein
MPNGTGMNPLDSSQMRQCDGLLAEPFGIVRGSA